MLTGLGRAQPSILAWESKPKSWSEEMEIINSVTVGRCSLEELALQHPDQTSFGNHWIEDLTQTFMQDTKGEFRIPAADNGRDVFFDSREVLIRFCGAPTGVQKNFLIVVRAAAKKHNVNELHVVVNWGSSHKTLKVTCVGTGRKGEDFDGPLNIYAR